MEIITKLISNEETRKIFENDKKKFVEIQNILNELMSYNAKYGITIDEIVNVDAIIEFCITVPEHSELKSDREFEMCGIYLANQFKTNATETVEKLIKLVEEFSKLPRIKVKYTSCIGSNLSEEDSANNLTALKESKQNNTYFPYRECQLF